MPEWSIFVAVSNTGQRLEFDKSKTERIDSLRDVIRWCWAQWHKQ